MSGYLLQDISRSPLQSCDDTGVPDEAYEAARVVFKEREIVDLTVAIGLMNVYNRMAISFRNTPQAVIDRAAA
jgi:alkylhydroperoxidase family enzyme